MYKQRTTKDKEYADTYKLKVTEKQEAKVGKEFADGEAIWTDMIENCLDAGREVLGVKDKFAKKPENKDIKELSELMVDTREPAVFLVNVALTN